MYNFSFIAQKWEIHSAYSKSSFGFHNCQQKILTKAHTLYILDVRAIKYHIYDEERHSYHKRLFLKSNIRQNFTKMFQL